MGVLFISHSSKNNAEATKVRDWLKREGYGEIFLDLDPQHGLAPGERWQSELKKAGENCAAVIVLISPEWLKSDWCRTEFLVAEQLGKRIFPVVIKPTPFEKLPRELVSQLQMADISDPRTEKDGFERLSIGLKRAGLDPSSFPWPPENEPTRNPYRGLEALDVQDAAVFFGRDVAITGALDLLRRMRADSIPRLVVILGSSGAGKSSFLRAGLLARLYNDRENFLPLPVLRPGNAALSGPTGLFNMIGKPVHTVADMLACFEERRAGEIERLKLYAQATGEEWSGLPPSIIIPLDQAEEFYSSENTEADEALKLISGALLEDGNAYAAATIRSDNYTAMQTDPLLADVPRTLFNLGPMSHANFRAVIEGPARYCVPPLKVAPDLTEKLLEDLNQDDALPLLGFTLERLAQLDPPSARMTLKGYEDNLGGLTGAIRRTVDQAFAQAREDRALPDTLPELLALAREAFIPWMVSLEAADADPRRRVARLKEIPKNARPLVRCLVDHRLLVSTTQETSKGAVTTVEVAHEAILRRWPELAGWIDAERDLLVGKGRLDQMLADWSVLTGSERDKGLASGVLLERARQWLIEYPERFGETERDFISRSDNAARAEEARKRRLQRSLTWGSAAAAVIFAVIGAMAVWQWEEAAEAREEAVSALRTATSAADRMVYDIVQEYRDSEVPKPVFRAILEQARNLLFALSERHPENASLTRSQMAVQNELGNVHVEQGNLRNAEKAYRNSILIAQKYTANMGGGQIFEQNILIVSEIAERVRKAQTPASGGADEPQPRIDDAALVRARTLERDKAAKNGSPAIPGIAKGKISPASDVEDQVQRKPVIKSAL